MRKHDVGKPGWDSRTTRCWGLAVGRAVALKVPYGAGWEEGQLKTGSSSKTLPYKHKAGTSDREVKSIQKTCAGKKGQVGPINTNNDSHLTPATDRQETLTHSSDPQGFWNNVR